MIDHWPQRLISTPCQSQPAPFMSTSRLPSLDILNQASCRKSPGEIDRLDRSSRATIPKAPSCLPQKTKSNVLERCLRASGLPRSPISPRCSVIKLRYDYSIQRGMLNAGAARSDCWAHSGTHHNRDDPIARTQLVSPRIEVLSGCSLPAMGSTRSCAWTMNHCRDAVLRCG